MSSTFRLDLITVPPRATTLAGTSACFQGYIASNSLGYSVPLGILEDLLKVGERLECIGLEGSLQAKSAGSLPGSFYVETGETMADVFRIFFV